MDDFDFKTVVGKIKEINRVVETCPDSVKEKCFELLFKTVFSGSPFVQGSVYKEGPEMELDSKGDTPEIEEKKSSYKLPPNVLAFSRKYGLSATDLEKLFILDHEPLLPIYKINSQNIARAQLQKVMMVLLENGLLNNQIKAPYQELRESCKEDGLADSNFNKTLKKRHKLFKGAIQSTKIIETGVVELTGDGYEKLAETIRELGGMSPKKDE